MKDDDIKEVKCLNIKPFTECVDDIEYVVPICNEINEAISKAIEKMIKESEEYVKYIGVVRPNEPNIIIERIGVKKDER